MNLLLHDPTGYEYMKLREQGDIEDKAHALRCKRACYSNGCRYEWGGDCFTGDPDKCEYWTDKTIMKAEIIREGDR